MKTSTWHIVVRTGIPPKGRIRETHICVLPHGTFPDLTQYSPDLMFVTAATTDYGFIGFRDYGIGPVQDRCRPQSWDPAETPPSIIDITTDPDWSFHGTVRKALAGLLQTRGVSQNRLARRIGISQSAISQYLAGNSVISDPGLSRMIQILMRAGLLAIELKI